ncbi:hypothetical protein SFR_4540 [Streptomyces sp. FR-008]|nr:hypothetical protein SFR_4540 [Streptomyces sp. FR-008]
MEVGQEAVVKEAAHRLPSLGRRTDNRTALPATGALTSGNVTYRTRGPRRRTGEGRAPGHTDRGPDPLFDRSPTR